MKLIIGLGNPGSQHENTRHNLGFSFLENLRRELEAGEWENSNKFKAQITEVGYSLPATVYKLLLVRPLTYMNLSGLAVFHIADYFNISPEDIIVIHDDVDLPLGQIKVRLGGSAAGHHGVESVIDKLGSDRFVRIRMGIGNWKTKSAEHGGNHINVEHYVLEPFLSKEKSQVKKMLKHAMQALEVYLEKGLEPAQNQFN